MAPRPRDLPSSFSDSYAAVAQHLQGQLGDALAAQAGPPTSVEVVPASDQTRVEAWNTPHPAATDAAMWQLAQQKYAEHRAAGLPDEQAQQATAEDLTHFRYRARQPLYSLGTTSWGEQVKEAARLSKLAAKQPEGAPPVESAGPAGALPAAPTPQSPPAQGLMPPGPQPTGGTPTGLSPAPMAPSVQPSGGLTSGY